MTAPLVLSAEGSLLLVIDVQEKLAPVMTDPRRVILNNTRLMRAAARLAVPVVVTEQYPQGIGPTVFDLREHMPAGSALPKMHFSCADDPAIWARIEQSGRNQIVIAGIEAHVCVLQSALGLLARGFQVFVVADACASRRVENEILAMDRLRQAGAVVGSVEMVLFEWLHQAGTPEFKDLIPLIK